MARRASSRLLNHISPAIASQRNPQTKAYPCFLSSCRARIHTQPIHPSTVDGDISVQKEEVVIVGAGIAGLAAAAMLHKLGIKSRVLEHADSLRTGGISLSLSLNAWNALDAIGVGDDLRSQYFQVQGVVLSTELGRKLSTVKMPDDGSVELRGVERKALLKVLADQLPPNTIQYSSRLAKIEKAETGETLLQLADGTQLSAEVVIGCDGVRSQVAKWMGFPEPKYAGHLCFRGLREYSEGQPHRPILHYLFGKGVRGGYLPISPTKVYWFLTHNSPNPGPMITHPSQLKQKARELLRNWPPELQELVDHTSDNKIYYNALEDRWLWPRITPAASTGRVVVAGDAWHPMTPNMGQGACSALEDAVLLSRKIHGAIRSKQESIEEALQSYDRERWPHVFKLGIKSNLVGAFLQSENPAVWHIRNKFVLPRLDTGYMSTERTKSYD